MIVRDAQREMRAVYLGGAPGQMVAGTLWLLSAAAGTWSSHRNAVLLLAVGGAFIFPVTQVVLRAMRRPASLSPANPLRELATQLALTVPISLPLVGAAAIHRIDWFYPAFMIVVGAHYIPFVFLYGMWPFALLGGLMVAGGAMLGMFTHGLFAIGGWLTGALMWIFAIAALGIARREARSGSSEAP